MRTPFSAGLPDARKNRILGAMAPEEYKRIDRRIEVVELPLRKILFDVDDQPEHVYFPVSGVVSIIHLLTDGEMLDIGVIGNEGMLNFEAFMGRRSQPRRALVQAGGFAARIGVEHFLDEFRTGGTLQQQLLTFTHTFLVQVSQTAVCNRVHTVEQRLCRWMMCIHDRLEGDVLQLTQEFLSDMLGSRRAGVNAAMKTLTAAGAIHHSRNKVTILDRVLLEGLACECYQSATQELQRTLGRDILERHRIAKRAVFDDVNDSQADA